jgi:hypothetical protein
MQTKRFVVREIAVSMNKVFPLIDKVALSIAFSALLTFETALLTEKVAEFIAKAAFLTALA